MSRHSLPRAWHRGRLASAALALLGLAGSLAPAAPDALAQTTAPATGNEAPAAGPAPKRLTPLDLRRIKALSGDPQAVKARAGELCGICHGPAGIATVPIFPNLAAQRAEYLYWELIGYQRGAYPESPMTALTADLSEQELRDLAAFYAELKPSAAEIAAAAGGEAATPPDPALLTRGAALFLDGDPAKGIPPCQACHGPEARGHALAPVANAQGYLPYAAYPALRGQHEAYLQARLNAYHQDLLKDSTNDLVMSAVAAGLDDASIQALSAYLASLPP